jgi:glycosyltransferase involved in cell wall biosynthesis
MVEKKGVRYLIEAMPQVCQATPQATLTLVGDGPERPALEKLVQQLGLASKVRFTGSILNEHLKEHYAQADIFVAPSIRDRAGDTEALGVVILEAAASGTPIVATNVGGIPDIVVDGQTGLLAEPANPESLANAILRLHRNPALASKLAANARELVESRFSWESVVDRFDTLFRQLLEQRAGELAAPG